MRRMLLAFLLLALVAAPAAGAWSWPVGGAVLRPFVLGDDPYTGGQHRGLDIATAPGETVVAPAAGTVSYAGTVPSGGRTVTIRTADGYAVTLLHLGSIGVREDASLAEGDAVGAVADTGAPAYATPFVYLGIRVADQPEGYLDPLGFLPARTQPPPPAAPPVPAPPPDPTPAPDPGPAPLPDPTPVDGPPASVDPPSTPDPAPVPDPPGTPPAPVDPVAPALPAVTAPAR